MQRKKSYSNHARHALVIVMSLLMSFTSIPFWTIPNRATASAPFEGEVKRSFEAVSSFIAKLPQTVVSADERKGMLSSMSDAEKSFSSGDVCETVRQLRELIARAQTIARDLKERIGYELVNRLWSIRHDVLSLTPKGSTCADAERFDKAPDVKINDSDNRHLSGVVKFGEPRMWGVRKEGDSYTEIEIPGIQPAVGEPGTPGVPVLYRLVAIPEGAKPIVKSKVIAEQTFRLNLYPVQPEPVDAEQNKGQSVTGKFIEPEFTIRKDIYDSDKSFPESDVKATRIGKSRGLNIVQLAISSGRYNPKSEVLTLFEEVQFEIIFEGGKGTFLTAASTNPFETFLYQDIVLNSRVIDSYIDKDVLQRAFCGGEEFLILTHPDFTEAAHRLAAWKREKGITTSVVNVNDGDGGGPDTKEEIDEFIENRFSRCNVRPSYVLLLGDAEFIAPFYTNTSGSNTTGTDYPYALISSDNDLIPDFAIGRIPVDTLAQANTVVDKIINYESNPPTLESFYKRVGIASQFQCCKTDGQEGRDQRSFIETSELVRNELIDRGYRVDRIYTQTVEAGYDGDPTPRRFYNGSLLPSAIDADSGFAWDGDTNDIVNAFNAGRFLFLHRDHGSKNGWAHPSFKLANVRDDLTNGELLPVVFSVNCASGLFDNETANGDYGTDAEDVLFSERLLRKSDGGAVGILGDTRDSPTWANSALTRGFFDAVWPNTVSDFGDGTRKRRLGDILNHGKLYLMTQLGVEGTTEAPTEGNITSDLFLWHVIGDPTLEMWTSNPNRLLEIINLRWLNASVLKLKYPVDFAQITAFQESKDGIVHLGRVQIKDGEAVMTLLHKPIAGKTIQFSASLDDHVSVRLKAN